MPFAKELAVILSSAICFLIIYYKLPNLVLNQILLILVALGLLLFGSLFKIKNSLIGRLVYRKELLIFTTTFFVQILILSTGGIYSLFLILLHLYSLGLGFLVNLRVAITFIITTSAILITKIALDPSFLKLFKEDPFTVFLYFASFLVIVPLAQFLMHNYHLKEVIVEKLGDYLRIVRLREASIFRSLNELIVVTDESLKILSMNDAAEKFLAKPLDQVRGKLFLEQFSLKDEQGEKADLKSLSVESALKDGASRIIKDFYLESDSLIKPLQVIIQLRPITDLKGKVSQLVFVFYDAKMVEDKDRHKALEKAFENQALFLDYLKDKFKDSSTSLEIDIELFKKREEDLYLSLELEDHPVDKGKNLADLAKLCYQVVEEKKELAKNLGVLIKFELPKDENSELGLISLNYSQPNIAHNINSRFAAPTNDKWFKALLAKSVEILFLLNIGQKDAAVSVAIAREHEQGIVITIGSIVPKMDQFKKEDFFRQYYGDLSKTTTIKYGSGLEGYIAKTIASQLGVSLNLDYSKYSSRLFFTLTLKGEN